MNDAAFYYRILGMYCIGVFECFSSAAAGGRKQMWA